MDFFVVAFLVAAEDVVDAADLAGAFFADFLAVVLATGASVVAGASSVAADAFLAVDFLAAAFFAGVFLAGVLAAGSLSAEAAVAAFLAGTVFLAGAFLAAGGGRRCFRGRR